MEESIQKSLEQTIISLVAAFDQQTADDHQEAIVQLILEFEANPDYYRTKMQLAHYQFDDVSIIPFIQKHENIKSEHKSLLKFIYNGLFTHFIRKLIDRNEGSACAGDKESFIIQQVMKSIVLKENQSLYDNYSGCERIDKAKWKDQAYWSPRSFKSTDEVIERFWKWYRVE